MKVTRRKVVAVGAPGTLGLVSGCSSNSAELTPEESPETVVSIESEREERTFSFAAEEGDQIDIEATYRGDGQGWFTLDKPDDQRAFSLPVKETRTESIPAEFAGTYTGTIIPHNRGSGAMDLVIQVHA